MKRLKTFFEALKNINHGSITMEFPNGEVRKFLSENNFPVAHIKIKDLKMVDECLVGGDLAFGETYMQDQWESENLGNLLLFFALNSDILEEFFHAHKFRMFWLYIGAMFRKNSKNGSKKNIEFHYDLGNDFYQLWLDQTMTYSSALFNNQDVDLSTAQKNKYQRILSKLSGKTILEIGCGWGGFAFEAFKNGYDVTGLTLSKEQKKYAEDLAIKNNFSDNFKVKLQDYRLEKNQYDNVVSIEMFEAVGKEYWNVYFQTIRDCLKENGKAVVQTITIDDKVFLGYQNRVDFIQKHIFPGGFLPSKSEFIRAANANGLTAVDAFSMGKDYQKTLLLWLDNFNKVKDQVLKLGFSEEFIRKWQFYLAYCAAGFGSFRTDVIQFEMQNDKSK